MSLFGRRFKRGEVAAVGEAMKVNADGLWEPYPVSEAPANIGLDDRRAYRRQTLTVPSGGSLPPFTAGAFQKDDAPWGTWNDDEVPQFTITEEGVYDIAAYVDGSGVAAGDPGSTLRIAFSVDDWRIKANSVAFDQVFEVAISRPLVVSEGFTGLPTSVELSVTHEAGGDRDLEVGLYIVKLV